MPELSIDQTPDPWSTAAAGYDANFASLTRFYAADLLDAVGAASGMALIDVAAGSGALSLEAARRGVDVLATDFAPGMIELLTQRFAAEGVAGECAVMDGQALTVADDRFDLACSNFGLIFFPDLDAGVTELARVVRRGGRVGVSAWRFPDGFEPVRLVVAAIGTAMGASAPPAAPVFARIRDVDTMRDALQVGDFASIDVEVVTHDFDIGEPSVFFDNLPSWAPPMRAVLEQLPAETLAVAKAAFATSVEAALGGGTTFACDAVLGVATV